MGVTDGVRQTFKHVPSHDDGEIVCEENKQLVAVFVDYLAKSFDYLNGFAIKLIEFIVIQRKDLSGEYSSASAAIKGILKGMYDAFSSDPKLYDADLHLEQKQYKEFSATRLRSW